MKDIIAKLRGSHVRIAPEIHCNSVFLGKNSGGKTICPDNLNDSSVIYSFGVGEDITFDLSMIEKYGVEVFAFDPTPRSEEYIEKLDLPEKFHFFNYGIYNCDASIPLHPPKSPKRVDLSVIAKTRKSKPLNLPMKRLRTIVDELGHNSIDILKMNIEASEYEVIPDIADFIRDGFQIKQIIIEFHHWFKGLKFNDTINMISILNELGYKIFNNRWDQEFSFIKGN